MTVRFISYLRVSSQRQGDSGLGLEAQREAVERFAGARGGQIVAEWTEIESGKVRDRPQLAAALNECRKTKATLLIARLDRLARNVAFVSSLMDSDVEFIAVDAPYANRLMLHILSAFAEHEREMISQRTKAALAAAKARGVVLGRHGTVLGQIAASEARSAAESYREPIERAIAAGLTSARQIARRLNDSGVPSRADGKWHSSSVLRVRARLAPLSCDPAL